METTKKSGLSTASLVLGIVGICTSFIPIINNLSFVMGILSFIFGIIGLVKGASKGKNISGIILGILAIVITLSMQKSMSDALDTMSNSLNDFGSSIDDMTGNKTEELLANSVDVEMGEFKVTKQRYTTDTELNVKVTNKTSEKKSFSIQIEAVDNDGTRLHQDTIYANNLNAGQSQNFKAFNLITSDKIEELKNATFKIVEVSMY